MTKATGRGRNWRRKGTWNSLAPSTQKRYQRLGIDKTRYESGARRGDWDKFYDRQSKFYGMSRSEVREGLEGYDRGAIYDAVKLQQRMIELYQSGHGDQARALWETRDQDMPEWMYYYHGMFS